MLTAAEPENVPLRLKVGPLHSFSYLWIISSSITNCVHPLRRGRGEAQLAVTCSKGTKTSAPIILKREAKITSVGTTRVGLAFFSTPPHADHFECSLLWVFGAGTRPRSSASWSLQMFSAHISRPQLIHFHGSKMTTHHLSLGLVPIRSSAHRPALG